MSKEEFGTLVRNQTIDELCTWLHSCIAQVDPNSEVYKACTAMVNAMAAKKSPETGSVVTHHPLTHDPLAAARDARASEK